jgi:peptide/nickel transport system substrate-binding protein
MTVFLSLLALLITLAACGNTSSVVNDTVGPNGIKYGGAVTIVPGPYGLFARNFNPFLADNSSLSGTRGMIYETLLFINREKNTSSPWLASSYSWSNDLTHLTFTLRSGVKWSDGQPFTSNDVVFSFNLLHEYSALDLNTLWSSMSAVTNPDAQTVVLSFKQPATPELWYVGGQTYIVPQHIWQHIQDPLHYLNPDPVGTGPFVFKSFDPSLYLLARNPSYWQPGKPYIDELRYPAYTSNDSAGLFLRQGSIDWTGVYSPDIKDSYVRLDPGHNHYWFPPVGIVTLFLNTAQYPFNLLPVRQAVSLAIDRERISKAGESSYEPSAHPAGIVLPTHQQFLDNKYVKLAYNVDQAKAMNLLAGAGFVKGRDGIYADAQGQRLAVKLAVVSGWTDWVIDCQIMADNLKAIGIDVTVDAQTLPDYLQALGVGKFDMAISWTNNGPTPYFLYYSMLASANTAPVGKSAVSNWERWNDKTTDHLLAQYTQSLDPAVQQEALSGLQKIMVEQLPTIPLVESVNWYEYTTARFVGWPDQDNPYAVPSPYAYPDSEQVVLRLHQN